MMKLLLIEDNREIGAALRQVLTADYSVTLTDSGLTGLKHARNKQFDLIILDLNLPDMAGLEVCQQLRADGFGGPVLILTGETKIMSKIKLLDAGADDYLTKPFSLGELKARLRVLLRRGQPPAADAEPLVVGDLVLDQRQRQVRRGGQVIHLRRKEFALLECLMLHAGINVSRTLLGSYAWQGADKPWSNTIDVHIKHLRDKLDRPFEEDLITTVHGTGYRLEARPPIAKEED
ncbi:MAG TPA: response regulator transcription factor [Candidatus Saccharimonadales bacterium]|nr:response regulator transcription factor [Candidatus Saccharimonadales bacterium]